MTPAVAHPRDVKTALRRGNLSGSFVVGKYSFSPYMACQHGCAYCDGRAERYWVDGDFGRDIVVRRNLPDLLEKESAKLRERGFISIGSGISDAYQPIERRERIMERCAAILAQSDHPVSLMTKSSLALRDIDAWAEVNRRTRFMLIVSLTHSDDTTRRTFEPLASSVSERLEVLRAFKAAGCATGVLAMPFLPGVTDTDENLSSLYDLLREVGVDWVMPGGLTLRPGRQKQFYVGVLTRHYPALVPLYDDLYRENRQSGAPLGSYNEALNFRSRIHNDRVQIPPVVPHRIYQGQLHLYDEVNVLLHHMVELYTARGTNTGRLKTGLRGYMEWLGGRKTHYNRRRSWRYEDLDAELTDLCRGIGEPSLAGVVRNDRLADFVSQVALDRKTFDYVELALVK